MKKRLLVCDLDNTLYDWVAYFVPSFYAMVDEVVKITGCDREQLLDDFRTVHRTHHDSEHPFALLETQTIHKIFQGKSRNEMANILDPAFHAFNSTRKATLHLYPGVLVSLDTLSESGITLVAHTESNLFAALDRLTRLEIEKYFKRIYCRERSGGPHPNPDAAQVWFDRISANKVKELSHHQRKPNPDVLLEICADESTEPSEAAYVGDSMARDILMAREANVYAIWAKYGVSLVTDAYKKLVRVTHWTDDDVEREKKLAARVERLRPDAVLEKSFGEIVEILLPSRLKNWA